MNEEEKKAIEVLIYCLDRTFTGFDKYYFKDDNTSMMIFQAIKTALNLIEKQQKEIEELKEHLQKYYNGELYTAKQLKNIEENQRKYFINKSKVKEIVELYDNTLQCTRKYNQDLADILCDLQELLEEGE